MDPYKILGIAKDASPDDVRRAYRKKAAQYHPDKGGDAWIFQLIQDAYDELTGKKKKKRKKSQAKPEQPQPQPDSGPDPFDFDIPDPQPRYQQHQWQTKPKRKKQKTIPRWVEIACVSAAVFLVLALFFFLSLQNGNASDWMLERIFFLIGFFYITSPDFSLGDF